MGSSDSSLGVAAGAKRVMSTERHYEVISPWMTHYYGGYEPPESGCCWALVKAYSAKEAIKQAIKLPEFKDWVQEARSDAINPFKGVKAKRTLCEHGNCWGCDDNCEECNIEFEAYMTEQLGE